MADEAGAALIAQQKLAWETGYKNIDETEKAAKNALSAMSIGVNMNKQQQQFENAATRLQMESLRMDMQNSQNEIKNKMEAQRIIDAETNATARDVLSNANLSLREREVAAREVTNQNKLKTDNDIADDRNSMDSELYDLHEHLGTPAWDIKANEIFARHTLATGSPSGRAVWDRYQGMQSRAKQDKTAALANDQKNFDFMAKHVGVTPYDLNQPFGLWGFNEPDDNHPQGSFFLAHDASGAAVPWQATTSHSGYVDKDGNEVQLKDGKPPAGAHSLFTYATVDAREAKDMTDTAERLRQGQYSHLYNMPAPPRNLSPQETDQQTYIKIMSDPTASPQDRAAAMNYFSQHQHKQAPKANPTADPNLTF